MVSVSWFRAAMRPVSSIAPRTPKWILFCGAIMSGVGMVMIGLMGSPLLGNDFLSTVVVVCAVAVVGVAHGFINAPVVSHVGQTDSGGPHRCQPDHDGLPLPRARRPHRRSAPARASSSCSGGKALTSLARSVSPCSCWA